MISQSSENWPAESRVPTAVVSLFRMENGITAIPP